MENKDERKIKILLGLVSSMESELENIKKMLKELSGELEITGTEIGQNNGEGTELHDTDVQNSAFGIFDGKNFKSEDGKSYPVNANYASKSRLVYGDKLKMIVFSNGKVIFKPIELVERKWLIGVLTQENGEYKIISENKTYGVLFASVTFYKAKPGDRLSIILPKDEKSPFATIDSILPNG